MSVKSKIAIVVSHPIQHFCPQYASFASQGIADVKIFFASALGYKKYHDPGFGQQIVWNNLYLNEFEHQFLNEGAIIQPTKNIDAKGLESSLEEYAPNLLIIYGYYQKLQRRAHLWATRRKIPIAYISDSERRQKKNIIWELIKYPFLYKYFSNINYFLTVGNSNEEYYRFHLVPDQKFIRMHFPIDERLYSKAYANRSVLRESIREKYKIRENEIVLTVVGKLVSWKSQDDIIKALELLEEYSTTYHLFIIGSGPMFELLKNRASNLTRNKVHFMGFVVPEELPAFYAATDIYIHPASIEPHSLSISEAIYLGCPIILSDRCGSYGATDDVQGGKNGLLYKYNDIRELTEKIKWLSDRPDERKRFSEKSHQLAVAFQKRSHVYVLYDLMKRIGSPKD